MAHSNLDPEPDPRDSPDSPEDQEPDTVSTPEGDAEGDPEAPLDRKSTRLNSSHRR